MNLIKNLIKVIVSSFIIYNFRLYSILKGAYFYRKLFKIHIVKNNIESNIQLRVIFEGLLYLFGIMTFFLLFKFISKYVKLDKFYLLIVVICPILFDISEVFYDKTCYKPWYDFDKFIWYFPIRLALWIFLFFYFKDLMVMLKSKKNLILIGCVFLIFHVFKIYSRYNF